MSNRLLFIVVAVSLPACGDGDAPDVPVATFGVVPDTLTGDAAIPFSVSDTNSRLVNVTLSYTVNAMTRAATVASSGAPPLGLQTTPDAVAHIFTWDTVADLGYSPTFPVALTLDVVAGAESGIGDEAGPFLVDNSALPQNYDLGGNVVRAATLFGTPGTSLAGTLYVGLYDNSVTCPPMCTLVAGSPVQNLGGPHDFADTGIAVPYLFEQIPAGTYKLIAVLDHNDNLMTGFPAQLVDAGDLVNSDQLVVVGDDNLQHDIVINYGYDL